MANLEDLTPNAAMKGILPNCLVSAIPSSRTSGAHRITAVHEAMLPRRPLCFLLSDDPGIGKTIMAGLLIKELIGHSDLHRRIMVCTGSLARNRNS